jgi:hypothetical protein
VVVHSALLNSDSGVSRRTHLKKASIYGFIQSGAGCVHMSNSFRTSSMAVAFTLGSPSLEGSVA